MEPREDGPTAELQLVGRLYCGAYLCFDCFRRPAQLSLVVTTSSSNTEDKVDNNSGQQSNSQNGRTKAVVETALTSHTDALCSPVEGDECVDHGGHGNQGE